jgi:60 kDa SS-A/Ro ribonucleoprotein
LAAQVKKGLAAAIANFDEYALAKYDRAGAVKLRDVLFLVHGKPPAGKEDVYARLAARQLKTPDTWEVALSAGSNKQESWERLIAENKLGALAFLRNLRNFELAEVSAERIAQGFQQIKSEYLLPVNFLAAAEAAPNWLRQIEDLMFRSLANAPKLSGHTVLVLDVSGSMQSRLSSKGSFSRLDVAAAMGMLAAEQCDRISLYVTAGSDQTRVHQTERLSPYRGFALSDKVRESLSRMGGGGIFTRQCLEFIRQQERETPDRIIVFSDSQDCDLVNRQPQPFGHRNYIIDVSAHRHGINYQGVWTAEVSGWSEHFLKYIAEIEVE